MKRAIAAAATAALVTACVQTPAAVTGTPVDLQKRYAAMDKSKGVGIHLAAAGGFWFEPDDRATWVSARGPKVQTRLSSFTADRVCVASVGNWSGACLWVYAQADGADACLLRFGNKVEHFEPCTISQTRWY